MPTTIRTEEEAVLFPPRFASASSMLRNRGSLSPPRPRSPPTSVLLLERYKSRARARESRQEPRRAYETTLGTDLAIHLGASASGLRRNLFGVDGTRG